MKALRSPSPWPPRALVAAPAALLGMSFGLGKIVRDCSLTCNVGFDLAPLAILAVALLTVPVSSLRVRLESRWGYRQWQVRSTLLAAGSFLAFRLLTWWLFDHRASLEAADADASAWIEGLRWAYLGFFVWLGAVSVMLGANVFAHAFRLYSGEERERALGYVAMAAVVGGTAGSVLAGQAAAAAIARFGWRFEVVRDNLMVAMAAALVATVPVVRAIAARTGPDARGGAASPAAPRPRAGLGTALRWLIEDGQLGRMALLVFLSGLAETVGRYLFYWLVSVQTEPSADSGRTLYFSTFYLWLNGASLLMLAFGTGRVIRRYGLGLALLSLPAALALGTAFLAVNTVLVVMYVMRIVEAALFASLYGPSIDRLYLGLDEEKAAVARPVINGLVARAGEGVGAVVLLVLTFGFDAGLRPLLWVYLGLLMAWVGLVLSLRGRLAAAPAPVPCAEVPTAALAE